MTTFDDDVCTGSLTTIPRHLVEDVASPARLPGGLLLLAHRAIARPCAATARLSILFYRARYHRRVDSEPR